MDGFESQSRDKDAAEMESYRASEYADIRPELATHGEPQNVSITCRSTVLLS